MLGRRRRRRDNIEPTSVKYLVFDGLLMKWPRGDCDTLTCRPVYIVRAISQVRTRPPGLIHRLASRNSKQEIFTQTVEQH